VMADLFVMVHDDPRVWRFTGQTKSFVTLESHDGTASAAVKTLCRVGTARDWRTSESFASAWKAGGGERFR